LSIFIFIYNVLLPIILPMLSATEKSTLPCDLTTFGGRKREEKGTVPFYAVGGIEMGPIVKPVRR